MPTLGKAAAMVVVVQASSALAHEVDVHRAMTISAAVSAENVSLGCKDFLSVVRPDPSNPLFTWNGQPRDAVGWMAYGSVHEDDYFQPGDNGGFRPVNHFYDPLTGKGLSDNPFAGWLFLLPDDGSPIGRSSFDWASLLNAPGIDATLFYGVPNFNTRQDWSWQNARQYQLMGLVDSDKATRDACLARMFRALGDVLHLLQDASQPQHVRNEAHLPYVQDSPIENYGHRNSSKLNYSPNPPILDWKAADFKQLKDFWDRDKYVRLDPPWAGALVANEDSRQPTARLGLAEFTSGNFIGERHHYRETMPANSRFGYPFPSLDEGTDWRQMLLCPNLEGKPTSVGNGLLGKKYVVAKVGQGRSVPHHGAVSYLLGVNPRFASARTQARIATVDDEDVLKDYHDILVPEAVKYSAGLLDYFFRGHLDVSASFAAGQYALRLVNRSGQVLKGGAFTLHHDDVSGNRTSVPLTLTWTDSSTLADGAELDGNFAGTFTQGAKFILVYAGTIGIDSSGQPLDEVDAGIAIAAKSFQPTPAQSSYEVASLPRPGATVLGLPSPIGDVAYDGNGVLRRWLKYGVRQRQTPDLNVFFDEWDGISAPPAGSVSEYLDQTTINRWDASEVGFHGPVTGSGGIYEYEWLVEVAIPGMSVLYHNATSEYDTEGSALSHTVTETFDVTWPVPDPSNPGQTMPASVSVTRTWTEFWEDEITLDDVVADCCGIYAAMPSLTPGGPSYNATKNAAGAIVDGCHLAYAFDYYPAGMGLWYDGSGTVPDEVSMCGCILYIPTAPVQKQTVTFNINGQQSSTNVGIPTAPSRYYPLDADCGWDAENVTP